MRKSLQLTLHFHWLRRLWMKTDIFGYSPLSKRGSLVCKQRRTGEAKTKVYILICKIFPNSVFKTYTSMTVWQRALNSFLFVSHENSNSLSFSLVSFMHIRAINTIATLFFDLYRQHWPPQPTFTCSKLTIETLEQGVMFTVNNKWRRSGVFMVNFEYISHLILVFLWSTLHM